MLGLAMVPYGELNSILVYAAPETFSNTGPLFPLKVFYGAPYTSYLAQLTILALKSGFEYNARAPQ